MRKSILILLAICGLGFSGMAQTSHHNEQESKAAFDVEFRDCSEFAGLTNVPTTKARKLVPAKFQLAGTAENAVMVVRIANCKAARIGNYVARNATVAQVGISINAPEGVGDINNYTLAYYTDSPLFMLRLRALGIAAQYVPTLDYDYARNAARTGGTLTIRVPYPAMPRFSVLSAVQEPVAAAVSFRAIWWHDDGHKTVKMDTSLPGISFGAAVTKLSTQSDSSLGKLIGGTMAVFPLLDSFNRFSEAQMQVRIVQ